MSPNDNLNFQKNFYLVWGRRENINLSNQAFIRQL